MFKVHDLIAKRRSLVVNSKSGEHSKTIQDQLTRQSGSSNLGNYLVEKVFFLSGMLTIIILFLILGFLLINSWPALQEISIIEFLSGTRWMPSAPEPGFGALPLILGSVIVTIGALVLSVPWSIAAAIYIGEAAPGKVREILKPVIEILEIFPSVVLGFIALVVISPVIANVFNLSSGLIGLNGAIVLAVMTLPTIISISEDALKSVPQDFKEASTALGATKWETVRNVSLPAASSGIVAATMLGFGRAVGETMAVLMAAGNALDMPIREILHIPVPTLMQSLRTLTATIAIEGSDVPWGSTHYHALFVLGLILFLITFAVNLISDIMLSRFQEVNRND